jgi:hypothetical protein
LSAGVKSRKRERPETRKRTITEIFEDDRVIGAALRKGTRDALRAHKLAGNPVATWKNGKIVWIQPEDIPVSIEPRGRHR